MRQQVSKVSVYVATSLDGFIARPDGALDWLNEANAAVPGGEASVHVVVSERLFLPLVVKSYGP